MRLSVTPSRLAVAPGEVARVEVSVINDGDLPLLPDLAVRGVEVERVLRVDTGVELAPGEIGAAVIEVEIPVDTMPGDLPFAVVVSDVDGLHEPELVVVPVEVGGRPPISVEVDPPTVHGRRTGRLDTVLRNHGPVPLDLSLTGASEGADVRFGADEVQVGAGEVVAVATSVHRRKRTWVREVRHGILIDVRGRGAPVAASTTFVQRPLLPPWLLTGTALLLILALWAGAVVTVGDRLQRPVETVAADVEEGEGDPADDPDIIAEEAEDGIPGEDGEDGDPADEDDEAAEDDAPAAAVVLAGETTGPRDPGGTRIIVERLSFGDPGTTGEGTKVAALTPVVAPVGAVVDRIETETDDRGRFGLTSGLATSAFYRVAAVREGFEVAAQVIRTGEEPAEYEVLLDLVPAPGAMSGRVTSTDGSPVGGAEVLISGGDLAYRTVTGSDGADAGTWSIEGIAAAPAYSITFRADRFASATVVRSIEGGERLGGVDAELVPNRGTIRGILSSRGEGVGAVTVDLVGEGIERSTTTLTAEGVEGTFDLPSLPFGTYQLTFSAPGWQTQTTEVVVDRGDVVVAVGDLQASTATIQGVVQQEVAPGGCAYPDPAVPTQRDEAVPSACGGVGVTLVGDSGTFSTTTATGTGSFTLSSIPPGTYTAGFERFGYQSQFLQVAVAAGDVLSLPDGAVGAAGTVVAASAPSPSPSWAAATGTPIIMRLVPPASESVGQLQGVLRSAVDPAEVYEPPAATVVEVVGQPAAEVELLPDGTVRATGLVPGAVTLEIRAPGHDALRTVVRVGGTAVAEAGTLLLTPLATLALRVTDSEELPIGDADVFLTTDDPGDLADAVLDGSIDAGVEECAVDRDEARRWRITDTPGPDALTGLCARVDAAGDVSFRQAVGTGSYRLITPVNQVDVAEVADVTTITPAQRQARARVVPFDHEQLERLVEVRSGETSRIDLRARRYAVIEGRIRKPSGAGFLNATTADFTFGATNGLEAFPALDEFTDGAGAPVPLGIGLAMSENGTPVTAPAGLAPRLSFGPDDGLPEGVYRINRVLPGEVLTTRDYVLEFYGADGGNFGYRGTNALTSFAFAETRSANAVLLPSPVEVQVRVLREKRSGVAVEVPGATVTGIGIAEYVYDSGGLLPIVKTATGVTGADGVALLSDGGSAQPYLESELLELSVTGTGLVDLDVDRVVPGDGTIDVIVTPVARTVRGTVQLVPIGASTPTLLAGLDIALDAVVATGDPPLSLSAGLTSTVFGNVLVFEIPGISPDDYRVSVSGPGVFASASDVVEVPVGPAGVIATVTPPASAGTSLFLADARLDLTVDVDESFTAAGAAGPTVLPVDGATVRLLRNGVEVATTPTDGTGAATFADLRGGPAWAYTIELEAAGYFSAVGTGAPFSLAAVSTTVSRELIRYGSVEATVRSFVSAEDPITPLEATVTVLDSLGDPVPGVPTFTSPGGDLEVPATAELDAGSYQFRFEAANHDTRTLPVTVTTAAVAVLGEVQLTRTRAGVSGTVTDDSAGTPPLPNVRVRAMGTGGSTVFAEDVTGADGRYSLTDLPPRALRLVFEEFADAAMTIPTSRRTDEVNINPDAGESLVVDRTLAREFVAISGVVSSRDFDHPDAPTAPLAGATVTATCVAGDCLGTTDLVLTEVTGAGGGYQFDVVNAGTYEVVVTADGHDGSGTRVALVVRFADDLSTVTIDEVLIATPISVPVSADSDRFPDLADIAVTATYVPSGPPVPTSATDARFVLTATTGAAGEPATLVLPPGDWSLSTSGATAAGTVPRPHRDGSATVTLAAADPVTPVALTMPAYVEVTGTVRSRPHTLADSAPLVGATVVPTPQGADPAHPLVGVAPTTGAGGAWSVQLPPTVGAGSTTWEVVLAATGHAAADLDITLATGDGDVALVATTPAGVTLRPASGDLAPAFHPGTGGIELTAMPLDQPVLVRSASGGGALAGITIEATWDTATSGQPAPPDVAAYTTTVASGTTAVTLQLAPGPWILTTDGAATGAGLPARPPHKDATGTSVTPAIGGTATTANLDLERWASITGAVETVPYTGADADDPTDATATVSVPPDGFPEAGSDADDVDGRWRVWIEDPADATVTLARDGFVDGTAAVLASDFAGTRDLVVPTPVTLTAGERDVAVTVASNVAGGVTDGATVVATDPTGTLPDRTAAVAAGVATFTGSNALEPIEWRFTTTDATGLPEPHKDLPASPAVLRTIPAGSGTHALDGTTSGAADERLVLTRYALVSGTVGLRDFASDGLVLTDGIAVSTATPAGAIAVPLSGVGEAGGWQVWLPDPALTTIRFQRSGYTTKVVDVAAAPGGGRDIAVGAPVSLVAIPRTVAVKVVSAADGSDLSGIQVTADADPDGDGLPDLAPQTVVTDANGVATFSNTTTDRRLAPAVWTFTTALANDHDPPHKDLVVGDAVSRAIPVGVGTFTLDGTVDGDPDERLELERYAEVTGVVGTQAYTDAAVEPTGAATLTVTTPGSGAVAEQPDGAGAWRVWVADPRSVTVRFELAGYVTDNVGVVAGDFTERAATAPDAVLAGIAREVRITVVSSDGSNLSDIDVTATGPTGAPGPFTVRTNGSGVARFRNSQALAPTTWTFTTTRGDLQDPPHEDLSTGPPDTSEDRTVPPGTGRVDFDQAVSGDPLERLSLTKYAFISGLVKTRGVSGGPEAAAESATVTETTSTGALVTSPTPATVPLGTWSAWVPEGASPSFSFTKAAHGPESRTYTTVNGVSTVADVVLTAATRPVTVTAVDSGNAGITFENVVIDLTGNGAAALPDHGPETTDANGVADFGSIEPIEYLVTTTGAAAYGRKDLVTGDNVTLTVDPGTTTQALDLPLVLDTLPPAVTGNVVEYRDGVLVPAEDVVVTGTRGAEIRPMSASTTAPSDNYALQLPAGTWVLTAQRSTGGPVVVVDAAYDMPTSGTGTAPTVVMPTASGADLSGTVTTPAGAGVDGATVEAVNVTNPLQTRSTVTDENGDYALVGLDRGVTWRVTYTPPTGVVGVPVSRFVAPGSGAGDITLSQEVPASLGDITVEITNGPASTSVTVVLSETGTPFPTMAGGEVTQDVSLDGSGAGTAVFSGLVPGDGESVPNSRFAVRIDTLGFEPFESTTHEVGNTVAAALVAKAPEAREVVLTVTDQDGDDVGLASALTRGGSSIPSSVTGGNVHTFSTVETGVTWVLEIAGHDPVEVAVPAGTTSWADNVTAPATARDLVLNLTDGTAPVTVVLPDTAVLSRPDPAGGGTPETVGGTALAVPPAVAGDHRFLGLPPDDWTLSVPGYVDVVVTIPLAPASADQTLTLVAVPRDVDLTLTDGGGDIVDDPDPFVLERSGFASITGTAPAGSNVYTFLGVEPGEWTLKHPDYADETYTVPLSPADPDGSLTLS